MITATRAEQTCRAAESLSDQLARTMILLDGLAIDGRRCSSAGADVGEMRYLASSWGASVRESAQQGCGKTLHKWYCSPTNEQHVTRSCYGKTIYDVTTTPAGGKTRTPFCELQRAGPRCSGDDSPTAGLRHEAAGCWQSLEVRESITRGHAALAPSMIRGGPRKAVLRDDGPLALLLITTTVCQSVLCTGQRNTRSKKVAIPPSPGCHSLLPFEELHARLRFGCLHRRMAVPD